MDKTIIESEIFFLEEKLLKVKTVNDYLELDNLISDEFVEYGSSGKVYNKKKVIESIMNRSDWIYEFINFDLKLLANDVVLANYIIKVKTSERDSMYTLRSSIWKLDDGLWKIIFHQGTVMNNLRF